MGCQFPRSIWGYRADAVAEAFKAQEAEHAKRIARLRTQLTQASAETARLKPCLATLEQEFAATTIQVQDETAAVLQLLNGTQQQLQQAMQREDDERHLLLVQIRNRETHLAYLQELQQRFILSMRRMLEEHGDALRDEVATKAHSVGRSA